VGERKEMILEICVGKHGLIEDRIIRHVNVGRFSKVVEHGFEVLSVAIRHTLQDVALIASTANGKSVHYRV
jgi:hypothetical protein